MGELSRRSLLRNLLKGGVVGASVAGFGHFWGHEPVAAQATVPAGDSIQALLDIAATIKGVACTHYYTALTSSDIQLNPEERHFLLAILDTEMRHLHYLILQHKAQMLKQAYFLPVNIYANRVNFADVTRQMEMAFSSALLAGVRRLAEVGAPLMAASFAQMATTDGIHLALVRQLENLLPNDTSFNEPMYYNLSEIAPVLRPFLDGGPSFTGPVAYPGDDAIRALVGEQGVVLTQPFSMRYG